LLTLLKDDQNRKVSRLGKYSEKQNLFNILPLINPPLLARPPVNLPPLAGHLLPTNTLQAG